MTLIVVGLNHQTAPVCIREQFTLGGDNLRAALDSLQQNPVLDEIAILSTCNRLEFYASTTDVLAGWQIFEQFLVQSKQISLTELQPTLYYESGENVAHHLMRVASGLDSMILGEPQILGQVNTAFNEAREAGAVGPILSRLFTQAIHCGKRARTDTDISRHTTSVSHAAVRLALKHIKDMRTANVLVVGAGEMAELAANALTKYNCQSITFINRTCAKAENLANQFNGQMVSWHKLLEALKTADVVICSTGAPHAVIFAEEVQLILPERQREHPLLLIDIAVPRDVEEAVSDLEGVIRYDIDDLNQVVDSNMAQRQASALEVERIIAQELDIFLAWLQSRDVVPVLVELREKASEIARREVQLALNRLDDLDDYQQKIVDRLAHRIVNKILHEPTLRLKEQAAAGNGALFASVLADLFTLDSPLPEPEPEIDERDTTPVDRTLVLSMLEDTVYD